MARPIKWAYDLGIIRDRLLRSTIQAYTRADLESLFNVKASTALTLLRAIGGACNIGGHLIVEKPRIEDFIAAMQAAPNLDAAFQQRVRFSEPVPRKKPIRMSLPKDLLTVTVDELPKEVIEISTGRIVIKGSNAEEVVTSLMLLAQALTNDMDTFIPLVDPPPDPRPGLDDELRLMFGDLRRDEAEYSEKLRKTLDSR